MLRIHLISGPRNISTALMYAFGNRSDTTIVDEPFYAYYLKTHPQIDHPGREETLETLSADYDTILEKVIFGPYATNQVFFKNMAHHLDGADWAFVKEVQNLFLIRNPEQLIASFAEVIPEPTMLDIGLQLECELLDYVLEAGQEPIVLDSNSILENPRSVIEKLCDRLSIPFSEEMLSWKAGPRKEDGVWAKYWYANVHKSTGFMKQKTSSRPFPKRLQPLLDEAQGYYNRLTEYSLT